MVKRIPRPKRAPQQKKRASIAPPREGCVRWSFRYFDPCAWGGENKPEATFREIAGRLKETESRPWTEILHNRKRDHYVVAAELTTEAQKRLLSSPLKDFDILFRFRFTGLHRLWGVREGDYFLVLWWDPEHNVCPSQKKHT